MQITSENQLNFKSLQTFIDNCKNNPHSNSKLLAILHKAQELYFYLEPQVIDYIACEMSIPTAHIWGVVTFYQYFNLQPIGKYKISVCMGTACYIKGAEEILNTIKEFLNINVGDTTNDKLFTLKEARCLGACGQAPAMMINDKIIILLDCMKRYGSK